jgi:hypothetical protein
MSEDPTVEIPYDIATDRPGRVTAPPSLPATPGWRPPTAAPARAGRPEGGDPIATAITPGRIGHPATVDSSPVAARALPELVPPSSRPSRGDREGHDPGNQVARPRKRADDADVDVWEAEMPPGVIRQEELEALDTLDHQRRQLDARHKALSRSILDRLESGSEVQPGRYRVKRKISNSRRPTFGALEGLYGEDFVRELKQHLEVRQYIRLEIVVTAGKDSCRAEDRGLQPTL